MIEIDPVATEVTNPADETVATAVFVDDHVTVAPDITVPPESFTVAVSIAVSANEANERLVGDIVTEVATGVVEGGGPVGVVPPSPHAASSSSTAVSRKYRILPRCVSPLYPRYRGNLQPPPGIPSTGAPLLAHLPIVKRTA